MNDKYIPKALQHAEWLELSLAIGAQDAADELRRLHEVEVAYGVMMAQAESRIAEQEPVALESVYETIIQWDENDGKRSRRELARRIVALYTAPQPAQQPRREWVGLTEQWKPVWIQPNHLQKARQAPFLCRVEPKQRDDFVPLYTTPPRREWVGLTDEDMVMCESEEDVRFVRAIEAKLREKNA